MVTAKTITPSDPDDTIYTCWSCNRTFTKYDIRTTCIEGYLTCYECDNQIKRTKPPKYRTHPKLARYVREIENGTKKPPFKMRTILERPTIHTEPLPLTEAGYLKK